jgi:excisionase family DNA binding protein
VTYPVSRTVQAPDAAPASAWLKDLTTLLVTPAEAARALRISPRTLWGLTDRGEVPCVRIGRAVRYDPRDLVAYVERRRGEQAGREGSRA